LLLEILQAELLRTMKHENKTVPKDSEKSDDKVNLNSWGSPLVHRIALQAGILSTQRVDQAAKSRSSQEKKLNPLSLVPFLNHTI
jgi:hypothetical protein